MADGFYQRWNFPHCVGAIDGKHVNIQCPPESGSMYFNYKGNYSIVLMAVANSNYEFIYVDIGSNGRVSDGGVWRDSTLNQAIQSNRITLPDDAALPNSTKVAPFVFVADDAFPLNKFIMKPYPFRQQDNAQQIFSYRLSRARMVIESSFGILANKFRFLHTNIALAPNKVKKLVLASIVLHNLLRKEIGLTHGAVDEEDFRNNRLIRGSWRMASY